MTYIPNRSKRPLDPNSEPRTPAALRGSPYGAALCRSLRIQKRVGPEQSFRYRNEIFAADDEVPRARFPIMVAATLINSDFALDRLIAEIPEQDAIFSAAGRLFDRSDDLGLIVRSHHAATMAASRSAIFALM
ncbi:hypothetical protein QIH87_25110 [Bradyrhizobium elkanii]|uniref:hypothetical protein n=1 Tax=Bradyrhizobium elkanii TaxID=29448 RepID=UPI0015C36811|nr:hypothetical protein [Bradyrhizobium elkanii]MCS3881497.1 hypothetical protein [Bradyrhizobium elkanii]NWL38235.1 hypothetical protein [Bradyrhizobium elkanii]WLB05470.1 hypothetical protein QIH87_25110 [Bradyrhizobium elkanii]